MTKQVINIGTAPNAKNGDALRTAFEKVNANFTELYAAAGADVQIPTQTNNGGKFLTTNGTTLSWTTTGTDRLVNGAYSIIVESTGALRANVQAIVSDNQLALEGDGLMQMQVLDGPYISLFNQGATKEINLVAYNGIDLSPTWTFDTRGKLTLPAGTTFEYLNTPLTGYGDGLARLDFTLVTDGVDTQWAAASASPAGSGYNPGDTFTFDEVFLGISGASVTIEVLTVGPGGSVENLAFTQPPLYPADIYRDSPINLQVGATSNRWTFRTGGYLNLPGGTSQIISSSNNVSIEANGYPGGSNLSLGNLDVRLVSEQDINLLTAGGAGGTWTFRKDGTLALPADLGTPVLTIDDVVPTPGIYRATTSNDPVAIREAYNIWYGVEENFKVIVEQDELIRGSNYPWHGMPSWEAYPLILNWNGDGLPPSSSLPPAAKTAMDSYFAWKQLESNIDIVSGNKTFSFENTGSLLLPGELTFGDTANAKIVVGKLEEATWTFGGNINPHALTWPDGSWQSSAFQGTATTAGGLRNENDATVIVDPLGDNKVWTFGADGNLTLPQSSEVKVVGITAVTLSSLETDYNAAEELYNFELTNWMTLNSHTPVWYLLPGRDAYGALARGDYDGVEWSGTSVLILRAGVAATAYSAWQTAVENSKLTVKSDTAAWTFDSTNKITLSKGGVVAGGDTYDIQVAYDAWQTEKADWTYVITTGGADTNIRPWHFAGPSRAEKQAVVLSMWAAQQNLNPGDTLGWTAISAAFYNEVRSWLALDASFNSYELWKKLTTAVNIVSEDKTWSFTNDGGLALPSAGKITNGVDTAQVGSSLTIENANGGGLGGWGEQALSVDYSADIISTYPVGSTITWQDGTTATITQVDDYGPIYIDIFWDTPKSGTIFPITLKTANYVAGTVLQQWTFGLDGNLTLPAGGDIVDSTGTSVLGSGTIQYVTKPSSRFGQAGDTIGQMAIDSTSGDIYVCINNYTDGLVAIWSKIAGDLLWTP